MSANKDVLDVNCVRALDGGRATSLSVRAQPGSRRTGFAGFWNGMPKIAVAAPPENGRANAEIEHALAELFELRKSAVTQTGGATSRAKTFRLECATELVIARLRALSTEHEKPVSSDTEDARDRP